MEKTDNRVGEPRLRRGVGDVVVRTGDEPRERADLGTSGLPPFEEGFLADVLRDVLVHCRVQNEDRLVEAAPGRG